MAQSMASIVLPSPPSWYPGHMRQFMRMLPALLSRTDVVLELRDARLPLTSINGTFEGMIAIYLLLIRGSFLWIQFICRILETSGQSRANDGNI